MKVFLGIIFTLCSISSFAQTNPTETKTVQASVPPAIVMGTAPVISDIQQKNFYKALAEQLKIQIDLKQAQDAVNAAAKSMVATCGDNYNLNYTLTLNGPDPICVKKPKQNK